MSSEQFSVIVAIVIMTLVVGFAAGVELGRKQGRDWTRKDAIVNGVAEWSEGKAGECVFTWIKGDK